VKLTEEWQKITVENGKKIAAFGVKSEQA
jgi:hypothetical protein